jgi:hypothetical protein
MRRVFYSVCAGAILAILGQAFAANDDALLPVDKFTDLYLVHPQVAGSLLVGLRWGGVSGTFDPDNVRVRLPKSLGKKRACVDVVSEDGRYSAENLYDLVTNSAQPRFFVETVYEDELHTYKTNNIAVIVNVANSCDDGSSDGLIPAIVSALDTKTPQVDLHTLVAYINYDPALVEVSLLGEGPQPLPAIISCIGSGDEQTVDIAYRTVCTIASRDALSAKHLRLHLVRKSRFETLVSDFPLLLSP